MNREFLPWVCGRESWAGAWVWVVVRVEKVLSIVFLRFEAILMCSPFSE